MNGQRSAASSSSKSGQTPSGVEVESPPKLPSSSLPSGPESEPRVASQVNGIALFGGIEDPFSHAAWQPDPLELLTDGPARLVFHSELITVINRVNNTLLIIRAFLTAP